MADDEGEYGAGAVAAEDLLEDIEVVEGLETSGEGAPAVPKDDPMAALIRHHPECVLEYAESIAPKLPLTSAPPLGKDPNHRSVPFLTQYERTKIIGMRANQLSQGWKPYIVVPEYVTSVSEIARMELEARRLPFIIRRPMPDGSNEVWRLSDLLILH